MSKHMDIGQYTVTALKRYFDLVPRTSERTRTSRNAE